MAAKATVSPGYRWRLGIIAIALLAFSGWFLYDGLVKYPELQRMELAFAQLQQDYPGDWNSRWLTMAEEEGWPTETPEAPRSDWSIRTQYICAAITLPIGLIFLAGFVRASGRWVASDETGLSTSKGQRAAWDQIEAVDSSRWKSKGIAVVHYKAENGGGSSGGASGAGRITLDDWKFDTPATKQIYRDIADHTTGLIEPESTPDPAPAEDPASV